LETRNGTQDGTKILSTGPLAAGEDREGSRQTITTIAATYEQRVTHEPVELPPAVEILTEARTADSVFVVDPDNRIIYWDSRAELLTGLMAEEMIGKPCYEALIGECEGGGSFCSHERFVMRLAHAGQPVPSYDMRVSSRWSGKRWVSVSILSVDSEEGPYLVRLLRDSQKTHETLEIARSLIGLSSDKSVPAPDRTDVPMLTPRQLEVLELLAEGKSVREIGKELYLSEATVRNHVRSLLQALGAHSQLEALARARQAGLLDR
jgi:PAS domain S-box-containing protein